MSVALTCSGLFRAIGLWRLFPLYSFWSDVFIEVPHELPVADSQLSAMLFMDGPRRISSFREAPDFLHVCHEGSAAIAIPAIAQSCDLAHFSLLSAAIMRRAAFYDIPRHSAAHR
jgi:hypothetical protein